ncbi:hypothetical protein [Arthrobacter zhaoxinii]|uniref:hypothetical protein n=1 Tax=Arthrobacter zhaoxinii TaxID=2964616 RepID=UPI002103DDB1|nr:hypothetical protein [Arthrobacter zhaoxinii]MCQ2001468.1 hypothetical protein [Arthrobacter zhaoxinii]
MDIIVKLAEILSAIGTVGALFFIANQTKQANNALDQAQEMLRIEQKRELRAVADENQQQASGIVSWPAIMTTEEGKQVWGFVVANTSPAPVFELKVSRQSGRAKGGAPIALVEKGAAILAPGRYFMSDRKDDRFMTLLKGDEAAPLLGNSGYSASLTFTDSNGSTWTRDARGSLSLVDSASVAA